MKISRWPKAVLAPVWIACAGFQPLAAELPELNKAPWFGYFAAYSNNSYRIGMNKNGEIQLTVMATKEKPVMDKLVIPMVITIEESLPDGQSAERKIIPESLTSEHAATEELEKVVVRGKSAGDAEFEITFEQARGMILIGGRVLGPGTLKNPLGLGLRASFAAPYPYFKEGRDGAAAEEFQKKIKGDHIDLTWTDKKRKKLDFLKVVDTKSPEVNGPGISQAEIDICSYDGKKFNFVAATGSAMTLSNASPQPLLKGFSLVWRQDPGRAPESSAKLAIGVK